MNFRKLLFALPIFFVAALFVTSCSDDIEDQSIVEVENYTEEAMHELQDQARCGRFGCFEFIFPVTFVFSDSSLSTVESYEEMKEVIRAWKAENPGAKRKPQLSFPVDVMTEDGEIVTLESREDLRNLVASCPPNKKNKRKKWNNACYEIAFPLTILDPDGNEVAVDDRDQLKALLDEWRSNKLRPHKPKFVFPISVILKETGDTVVVNDQEELKELRQDCRGN